MKVSNFSEKSERNFEYMAFKWMLSDAEPDELDGDFFHRKVRLAIRRELTPTQRKYVWDYYMRGHSMEAIGIDYGVNKSTVSRGIKRAKKKLFRALRYASPKFL